MSGQISNITIFEGEDEEKPKILRVYTTKTGKTITRYVSDAKDRSVNKDGNYRKERCDKGVIRGARKLKKRKTFNEEELLQLSESSAPNGILKDCLNEYKALSEHERKMFHDLYDNKLK